MNVSQIKNFTEQQLKYLKLITDLIEFDKGSEKPENARVLEAFCATQNNALLTVTKLLEKHKDGLLALEKAEAEKQKAERAKVDAKKKEEQKKEKISKDLKTAETSPDSLFSCEDEENTIDDYAFEEND